MHIQRQTTNLLVDDGVHDLTLAGAGIPLRSRIWVRSVMDILDPTAPSAA